MVLRMIPRQSPNKNIKNDIKNIFHYFWSHKFVMQTLMSCLMNYSPVWTVISLKNKLTVAFPLQFKPVSIFAVVIPAVKIVPIVIIIIHISISVWVKDDCKVGRHNCVYLYTATVVRSSDCHSITTLICGKAGWLYPDGFTIRIHRPSYVFVLFIIEMFDPARRYKQKWRTVKSLTGGSSHSNV